MRKLLIMALLLATPAAACDPEEMDRALSEICTAAATVAQEAVEAAQPLAQSGERTAMQAQLDRVRTLCIDGDPAVAASEAARLARFAGRIEARADTPRPASF
ncbi:MAG: hypothetical protein JWR10_4552 [Rubritepida sp.]|nr:hypothetical protein [Rubritepida sp.]